MSSGDKRSEGQLMKGTGERDEDDCKLIEENRVSGER